MKCILNKNLVFLSLIFLMFIACTKSLEEVEPTSVITLSSFFQTEDDARAAILGVHASLRDRTQHDYNRLGDGRSELFQEGRQAPEGHELYYLNTLTEANMPINWTSFYKVIHDANTIIEFVPGIEFTLESEKNYILAQAYAIRAYVYFIMARTWGGVPLITQPTSGFSPEEQFVARAPVSEVFSLIKTDIEQSLSLFGSDNSIPGGRILWSKPAVSAMKGEVFLWTSKLMGGGDNDAQTALSALQDVQKAEVDLLDNFDDVFRESNEGNSEVILAMDFTEIETGQMFNNRSFIANGQVKDFSFRTELDSKLIGDGGGLSRWAPSETMRSQFTLDDSRRSATFVEGFNVVGSDTLLILGAVTKYRGREITGQQAFYDDVILYRYADVLLMIAEAKNVLGQDPTAEMMAIRTRAYGANIDAHTFVNGSQAENDEAILQERLFETAFEGKRYWDLVRFGEVFNKVPTMAGKEILFPIASSTRSFNPSIDQNPGY